MKKIFLAAIVIAMTIACSTEATQQEVNEIKFNTDQKADDDLETLFNNMVSSQAYIDLQAKSKAFAIKMNYTEDIDDLLSENEILTWISSNLSTTNFIDFKSAMSEYDDIKASANTVATANKLFFNKFGLSDPSTPGTFQPWKPQVPPTEVANCTKLCWDNYVLGVVVASNTLKGLCYYDGENASTYMAQYQTTVELLEGQKTKCLKGCE